MDLSPAFKELDERERVYVEARLRGISPRAAAVAAGCAADQATVLERRQCVTEALVAGREISIRETGFDRAKISEMLMDAYRAAENATEMVMAARELGKLHGVYAPAKVEVKHEVTRISGVDQLSQLTNDQLERVARGEIVLEGEFTEVTEAALLTHGGEEQKG